MTILSREARVARAQSRIRAAFALEDPSSKCRSSCGRCTTSSSARRRRSCRPICSTARRACWHFSINSVRHTWQRWMMTSIPYLTPYFGTGVLASGFGVKTQFAPGRDPSAGEPILHTPAGGGAAAPTRSHTRWSDAARAGGGGLYARSRRLSGGAYRLAKSVGRVDPADGGTSGCTCGCMMSRRWCTICSRWSPTPSSPG